ncbi:MAG: excinuclease ABC subunit UvrB [Clostridia bacterium]|nr:excinuclease ABC subunit UvrB [Clostridia bacterium]
MDKFELVSKYQPTGDQPTAIQKLTEGIEDGFKSQVLLGVTGSGKTFTMANVIQNVQRPTLVIAHNKTLAAQLCNELRDFFPHSRVEFFVSYYDYYQPEAYIASTDTYIEKDMAINDEIDKLRHSATCSLIERRDTIVVASVSCIYGLGSPEEYSSLQISLRPEDKINRNKLMRKLVDIQYMRNDIDFARATFRVRGDVLEIFPAYSSEIAVRIEFFGDVIEKISEFNALTGKSISILKHIVIFPASHYAVGTAKLKQALDNIKKDAEERVKELIDLGKVLEAERLKQRTAYDLEMMQEVGYCNGIENYSRYFDGRQPGEAPYTLMDYFSKDFITFIDESHMSVPQIRAMYSGDRSRKTNLVDYGFRLPSAYDNRPLNFAEFNHKLGQVIYISATPAPYELKEAAQVAEQIIRPTGLVDPEIEVRKIEGQIDDLMAEISRVTALGGRVLVTTLTKKMSEELTKYLAEYKIKVRYLHSEIDTLERIEILNALRMGEFDVLVGINLLREGLDLPEVMLVAILDADKEGFLRSESALIQTVGRAARNVQGKVIMYANNITGSMKRAIDETNRRRKIQREYNKANDITPQTIIKEIKNSLEITKKATTNMKLSKSEIPTEIEKLKGLMQVASASLDFEQAIKLRDTISELKKMLK